MVNKTNFIIISFYYNQKVKKKLYTFFTAFDKTNRDINEVFVKITGNYLTTQLSPAIF